MIFEKNQCTLHLSMSSKGSLPSKEECMDIWRTADAVCFDIDSTLTQDEAIDQLAAYSNKEKEIKVLTEKAMQGGIDFTTALRQRLNILRPSLDIVQKFVREHPPNLTPNSPKLVSLLCERGVDVYLVSGGFRSLIAPVARLLKVPLENIFANRLKFFYDGHYGGFDEAELTCQSDGKGKVIKILKEKKGYARVVMIGDGVTDMEACPPADAFIGFGGNVVREAVRSKATWYIYDFETLIEELLKDDPS